MRQFAHQLCHRDLPQLPVTVAQVDDLLLSFGSVDLQLDSHFCPCGRRDHGEDRMQRCSDVFWWETASYSTCQKRKSRHWCSGIFKSHDFAGTPERLIVMSGASRQSVFQSGGKRAQSTWEANCRPRARRRNREKQKQPVRLITVRQVTRRRSVTTPETPRFNL